MILVTGGAGYIGSHFIKTYLKHHPDADIAVVDNLSAGHREALDFVPKLHFFEENIGNTEAMVAIFKQLPIEAVVHFAASCYVGESQVAPSKYFQNNVINSLNMFKAMDDCGVTRIVFSSTCATYGNPQYVPIDEAHPQNPINVYGMTKLMMEQALKGYCMAHGWSAVALRYFNAAGADEEGLIGECHDPETHLIPNIYKAILGTGPALSIFGDDYDTPDGTCIRDYIHINDLGEAHCRALAHIQSHKGFEFINLGTTHGASVKEVMDLCREISGKEIPHTIAPRRDGDPPRLVANADKAARVLGWKAEYSLRKILETAWAWEQGLSTLSWDSHTPQDVNA